MNDLTILKNMVRTGIVSSVNKKDRTARVTFADKGQEPIVSGALKVLKNPPFIPAKDVPQQTETQSGGSGYAEFAAHKHDLTISPWLPSPGDYVLCIYIPTDDGDGFVIGGI
jgi:phage baseplate assembly protein gpV